MRRFQLTTVLMLGTFTLFLTGCSRNPVSPDVTTPTHGAESMGTEVNDMPSEVEGGTPSSVTASFSPTSGGRLTAGRFTLELHKNSLKMPATITLRVASAEAMEAELVVEPAEANNLQVNAEITASLADQPQTNWDAVRLFAWQDQEWAPVEESTAQVGKQNVVGKVKSLGVIRVAEAENTGEEIKNKNK